MSYQQFIDAINSNNLTALKNMYQSDPNIINEVNTNSATLLDDLIKRNIDIMNPNTPSNNYEIITGSILKFLIQSGINLPESMDLLFNYSRLYCSTCEMTTAIYERLLADQKQYYENLLKEKLQEQKEQLLEEIYAPPDTIGSNDSPYRELRGIGYSAAKERFES